MSPEGLTDPVALAARGRELSGIEYVRQIFDGELPPPPISQLMGFRGVEFEHGRAVFEMTPGPEHYNPIGSVHGGIALTLLDSAMGCAVHTTLAAGVGYTTLEVKTNFVRPITAETGRDPLRGHRRPRRLAHRDRGGQARRRRRQAARARDDDLSHLRVRPPAFTTRPELRGTFGAVASTHWLGSAAGMAVLERGGNAFDAAVATGFTLQVVEPHLNGPGGEVPAVFWSAERGEALALCGQGVSPAAATIERYRELGHELVPGHGRARRLRAGRVRRLAPAPRAVRHLAASRTCSSSRLATPSSGFPLVAGIRATIERTEELLETWPGSRELYLPPPEVGTLFRNPVLAATYRRIADEARGGSREDGDRARAPSLLRGVRRGRDRPFRRRGGRSPGRPTTSRPGAPRRARRLARVPRADRLQDAAVGSGSGRPAAARAARRL